MLKALIKKQFAELAAVYSFNKKKGQQRSKGGAVGLMILLAFGALSIAFAFFGMGMLFSSSFVPMGLDWLHFAMMGMIAVFVSLVGEVFATYSMLYNAKDNELLLSMPIPSRTILLSRMVTLYIMSVFFVALAFVPATIAYFLNAPFSAAALIFCIILVFVLALIALTLACLLGWVVALIGSLIKGNKAVITVIISVVLLAGYYVVYFRLNKLLQSAVNNAEGIATAIKGYIVPFYYNGMAAVGSLPHMLIFTAGAIVLFALALLLLSKNFNRIVTKKQGAKAVRYNSGEIKRSGVESALLGREFKRLTSSAAYMLNCGLGVIMMIGVSILALVKSEAIRSALASIAAQAPFAAALVPAALVVAMMFLLSMNPFTAPSVSLEGSNIWILQTMPVDAKHALRAKRCMHYIINGLTALICSVMLGVAFGLGAVDIILVAACSLAFVVLTGAAGLAINLKKPFLDWTNETVAVKQGASVVISLFGGWGFAIVIGGLAAIFALALNGGAAAMRIFLAAAAVLQLVIAWLIVRWIDTKGARIFEKL